MSTTNRRSSITLKRWGKLKALEQAKLAAAAPEQAPVSQRTLDRITQERDELNKKLESALKTNQQLKNSFHTVAKKVMDIVNPTPFVSPTDKDPSDVSEEELISMIGSLISVEKNETLESRIEELETRITLLSGELGKLLKLKLNTESTLKEVISCQDLDRVHHTVKQLWLQSCSTKLFVGSSLDLSDLEGSQGRQSPLPDREKQSNLPPSVQINIEPVKVSPPDKEKKAGDTHIKNMQLDLRQVVIQDLSLYKGNGADWRMFAQRVGIPDNLISTWHQMRLAQPMKNVLGVWASSPGATVRMLHRHLVSPQMRCVMLAKRISDYYIVD